LNDAVKQATDVNNDVVLARALGFMGDSYFYSGDFANAKQQYDHALQVATKAKSQEVMTILRFDMARLDVMQNRQAAAVPALKKLVEESDSLGLKALSVQASVWLAQALIGSNKMAELDRALNRSEKLGLQVEQARAHFLLGEIYGRAGKTREASPQYQETVRILESISKESGAGRLLDRSDLKDLYRDAVKAYQGDG
jgi:tetratricopeptide (TPR) repeat protein